MLGKKNPEFKYFIDGRELQCVEVEKDLGVFVDKIKTSQVTQHSPKNNYVEHNISQNMT